MSGPMISTNRFPKDAGRPQDDQRYFSKTADEVNWRNGWSNPLRGGYRL